MRQACDHHDLKQEIRRLNQVTREQNFKLQDMNRNLEGKVRERTKQLAEKHQELRTAYVQTIRALAEAVDAKDAYTRGHSERVGVYASKIAREMGFPKEFIERVYIAGLLHDVGKIGVPDAVITKPDRLDASEEYARDHEAPRDRRQDPRAGRLPQGHRPCVRHHHEWYDGSNRGYPDRLLGDQIPLPSRIILVADTVEAMTSDRPYRKAMSLETVVRSSTSTRAAVRPPAWRPSCGCSTTRRELHQEGPEVRHLRIHPGLTTDGRPAPTPTDDRRTDSPLLDFDAQALLDAANPAAADLDPGLPRPALHAEMEGEALGAEDAPPARMLLQMPASFTGLRDGRAVAERCLRRGHGRDRSARAAPADSTCRPLRRGEGPPGAIELGTWCWPVGQRGRVGASRQLGASSDGHDLQR